MTDHTFDIADEEFVIGGPSGFDGSHNDLAGRGAADAHPMEAITGLADALAAKQDAAEMLAALAALTPSGTPSATTFLRGDGAWATPEGGGGEPTTPHWVVGIALTPSTIGAPGDFVQGDTFEAPPISTISGGTEVEPASIWWTGSTNDRDGIYADSGDAGGGNRLYRFVGKPGVGDLVWVALSGEVGGPRWRLWQITPDGLALVAPLDDQLADLASTVTATATSTATAAATSLVEAIDWVTLPRRPTRLMSWVFGRHDGARFDDGVEDWIVPETEGGEPVLIDHPTDAHHGLPIFRPTASTIGGKPIGPAPHTVICLANQATPEHNGIWELKTDVLGVEGIFCVRTQTWNGTWGVDEAHGVVPVTGTPFVVGQNRLAVLDGVGLGSNSVELATDARSVAVSVDGLAATTVEEALAELLGMIGG